MVPPLQAGVYAFWIQETGPSPSTYRLDFDVAAVPEPQTWALLAAGLLLVIAQRAGRRCVRN